jgi:hypothetical protein
MIQKQSKDPDVVRAAQQALDIINDVLTHLPEAENFDYGGHQLKLGEYGLCLECTKPIAEAQQAHNALQARAETTDDSVIKEHIELAAELLKLEADAAVIRAEFHNGFGTEKILDQLLGFQHERKIYDDYNHSHHQGN